VTNELELEPRFRVPRGGWRQPSWMGTTPRFTPEVDEPEREPITEVLDGLWIGNLEDARTVRDMDLTVNVSGVPTPEKAHGEMHINWPLSDGNFLPELSKLAPLVRMIADVYRRDSSSRIFIHCAMGWNRSGIIMALVLRLIKRCTGAEALRMVRKARSKYVLCNRTFEDYVASRPRPVAGSRKGARR
jgi:protein-tyrosine phosphatase